ncbi:MAG: ABC transporter substrate-binding protein, partial [Pollutimonas bauzanensis]
QRPHRDAAIFDPRKDFRLRYTASPMDALQLLVMRQVDHALLAEPAVSMALRKTQSFPVSLVAPQLYRSVGLQDEWGRLLRRDARIPQAGMAAVGAVRLDAGLLANFEAAYAASALWCAANPQACGKMVAARIDMLEAEAVADSLLAVPQHYATAAQARPELEYFFQLLLEREPATLGGKLPGAAFYGGAPAPA